MEGMSFKQDCRSPHPTDLAWSRRIGASSGWKVPLWYLGPGFLLGRKHSLLWPLVLVGNYQQGFSWLCWLSERLSWAKVDGLAKWCFRQTRLSSVSTETQSVQDKLSPSVKCVCWAQARVWLHAWSSHWISSKSFSSESSPRAAGSSVCRHPKEAFQGQSVEKSCSRCPTESRMTRSRPLSDSRSLGKLIVFCSLLVSPKEGLVLGKFCQEVHI